MKKHVLALGAAIALTAPASAAVIGTLSFDQPTGTVLSDQTIDIDVTLMLDAASDAITTDGDGNVTSGLSEADIAAAGADPAEVLRTFLTVAFECTGNFTNGCIQGPPYDFDFDLIDFYFETDFSLQPRGSYSFRFGIFTPTGGNAPAGTYSFYNAIAQFGIQENDGDVFYSRIAETCPQQNPACAFTRTVNAAPAVPEPASWALMIAGFGLAGMGLRSRRTAMAFA